jgi:hypothetical protein
MFLDLDFWCCIKLPPVLYVVNSALKLLKLIFSLPPPPKAALSLALKTASIKDIFEKALSTYSKKLLQKRINIVRFS